MQNFRIYSPEEEIKRNLFTEKQVHLFIKRDDLIHPFISGNKWRKLKYHLMDAKSLDKNHLITFGGAYSNHLLATACAAAIFGFKATGIVRGEKSKTLNNTLFLCEQFGMNLLYVNRSAYRDPAHVYDHLFRSDKQTYYIPEGGSSFLALPGCAELIDELSGIYDYLFLACGTGGTLAGLAQAVHERKLNMSVEGVPVLKGADFLHAAIRRMIGENPSYTLHMNGHLGGYAKTNPEYLRWLKKFNRHGILLDHVYTGKMMHTVFRLIEQDYFKPGAKILALHTGGLIGLLGISAKFSTGS